MPNFLSPIFNEQTFDTTTGDPLFLGQIETYEAGTSTPLATYTTQNGITQQSNPIILNARGEPTSPIWLAEGRLYKFVLKDPAGVVLRTVDDVGGVNDSSTSTSEWISSGFVPTFISAVSFSVQGDQTLTLIIGRRIRTTNSGGTTYSLITNSIYNSGTGLTTVTVLNDSGTLDAGLSVVDVGILTPTNPSLPNSQPVRQALGMGFGDDIASAATLDLTARTGNILRLTGTTPITALTMANGDQVLLVADAAAVFNVSGVLAYTCKPEESVLLWQDGDGVQHAFVLSQTQSPKIQQIPTPTFNAGAMTIPAQAYTLDFQDPATGVVTTVNATAAALVVPSGATLGVVSAVQSELALLALFPSANTIEYAITNIAGGVDLSETGTISTTAIGTGSDSANVVYSTTARSNVQYRVLGRYRSTQTTAGTWAQSMTAINGAGTQGINAMGSLGYGQTWQNVSGSRSLGTTYYNTTGKPILVKIAASGTATGTTFMNMTINGTAVPMVYGGNSGFATNDADSILIPANASYVLTAVNSSLINWYELR